jgi:hypothetical protein
MMALRIRFMARLASEPLFTDVMSAWIIADPQPASVRG